MSILMLQPVFKDAIWGGKLLKNFGYEEGRGGENGKVICENRSYGYGISSELLSKSNLRNFVFLQKW